MLLAQESVPVQEEVPVQVQVPGLVPGLVQAMAPGQVLL